MQGLTRTPRPGIVVDAAKTKACRTLFGVMPTGARMIRNSQNNQMVYAKQYSHRQSEAYYSAGRQ